MSWIIRQNHWDICSTGQPAGESSSCERQEACLFQQHLQQRWEQLGRFHFSWAALSTGNHNHWVFNHKHGRELSGGLGVILTSQKNLTAPSPGRWELASPCTRVKARVASSLQGTLPASEGFSYLLKSTSAVLWGCSDFSPTTSTPSSFLSPSRDWTKNLQLLSPEQQQQQQK